MNGDRPILTKLFFSFVNLSNEINKSFASLWYALFRPVNKVKLSDCSRLPVLKKYILNICEQFLNNSYSSISDFKFTQNILRHVILRNGIDHEVQVSLRSL